MSQQQHQADIRPFVSAKDIQMILSAVGAYAHNSEYRDLRERLERQAIGWGVVKSER